MKDQKPSVLANLFIKSALAILIAALCSVANASAQSKSHCDSLLENGGNFYTKNDFKNALQLLLQSEKCGKKDTVMYFLIGRCFLETGNYEEGVRYFDKFNQLSSTPYFWSYGNQGACYMGLKNYHMAMTDYDKAIGLYDLFLNKGRHSDDAYRLFSGRGDLHFKLKEFNQAELDYKRSIKEYSFDVIVLEDLYEVLVADNKTGELPALEQQIIKLNPTSGQLVILYFYKYCNAVLNHAPSATVEKQLKNQLNTNYQLDWNFDAFIGDLKASNLSPVERLKIDDYLHSMIANSGITRNLRMVTAQETIDSVEVFKKPKLSIQAGSLQDLDMATFVTPGATWLDHNDNFRKYSASAPLDNSQCQSKQFVITHNNGIITIWEPFTGQVIRRLINTARVLNISISADGYKMATTDVANIVRIWDCRTGLIINEFRHCGSDAAISPDEKKVLIIGEADDEQQTASGIYDAVTGSPIFLINTGHRSIEHAVFSPGGDKVLLGDFDGLISVYDVNAKVPLMNNEINGTKDAYFSKNGNEIVVYGDSLVIDKQRNVYESKGATVQILRIVDNHQVFNFSQTAPIENAILSSNGATLLVVGRNGHADFWSTGTNKKIYSLDVPGGDAGIKPVNIDTLSGSGGAWAPEKEINYCIGVTPDEKEIVTAGGQKMYFWDASTGNPVRTQAIQAPGDAGFIKSMSFSANGGALLMTSGLENDRCFMVDAEDGKLLASFTSNHRDGRILNAAFSIGQDNLMLKQDSGTVFMDLKSGGIVSRITDPTPTMSATDDWKLIIQGGICYDAKKDSIIFDTHTKKPVSCYAITSNGSRLFLGYRDGSGSLWDLVHQRLIKNISFYLSDTAGGRRPEMQNYGIETAVFSPKRHFLAAGFGGYVFLLDSAGNVTNKLPAGQKDDRQVVTVIAFSCNDKRVAAGLGNGDYFIWNIDGTPQKQYVKDLDKELWTLGDEIKKIEFINDDDFITLSKAGMFKSYTLNKQSHFSIQPDHDIADITLAFGEGKIEGSYLLSFGKVNDFAFSAEKKEVATVGADGTIRIWDCSTGKRLGKILNSHVSLEKINYSPDNQYLAATGDDGTVHVWDAKTAREKFVLVLFAHGDYAVFNNDGYFDTSDPEKITGIKWVFPDDPFSTLSPEIFMRNYYYPGLLSRSFTDNQIGYKVNPQLISDLNRVQPLIKSITIVPQKDSSMVDINVTVLNGSPACSSGAANTKSGVFDVRLFRNNRLVGEKPNSADLFFDNAAVAGSLADFSRANWRKQTMISLEGDSALVVFKNIRLADATENGQITFSAYAFNLDRVKSLTKTVSWTVPKNAPKIKPRFFILSVGVSSTQNGWNLASPANDARAFKKIAAESRALTGGQVIPITFISSNSGLAADEIQATKENIKYVLGLLSRKSGNSPDGLPITIPQNLLESLKQMGPLQPEDELLITFSGHGFATPTSLFYLVPQNTGDAFGLRPDDITAFLDAKASPSQQALVGPFIRNCISTEELSSWIRQLDCDHINLIVDACYSGAVVGAENTFRPGPMGDPGFGQLAYDKKVRILTATQAAEKSIGNLGSRYGLLTYALLSAGLPKQADGIDFHAWFGLAVSMVPPLYQKYYPVNTDKLNQIPQLYDFNK